MAALGTDEPNDTREAFVGFFMKSAFGYREAPAQPVVRRHQALRENP